MPICQEEKGVTEDEMVRWHHQLNGQAFEQTRPSEWIPTSSIPFTVPSKTIKWLGISITKEVEGLYFQNYGAVKSQTWSSNWTSDDMSVSLFISLYTCSQLYSLQTVQHPTEGNPGFRLKAEPRREKPAHPRQLLKALRIFPNLFLNCFNTSCQHVVTGRVDVLWAGKVSNAEQVAIVCSSFFVCVCVFFFDQAWEGKGFNSVDTGRAPSLCEPGNGPAQLPRQPALLSRNGPCADAMKRQTITGPRAG